MSYDIPVLLEDDNINEQEETFIVFISVTRIADFLDQNEDSSSRIHTIVKILVDPNAPDSE